MTKPNVEKYNLTKEEVIKGVSSCIESCPDSDLICFVIHRSQIDEETMKSVADKLSKFKDGQIDAGVARLDQYGQLFAPCWGGMKGPDTP